MRRRRQKEASPQSAWSCLEKHWPQGLKATNYASNILVCSTHTHLVVFTDCKTEGRWLTILDQVKLTSIYLKERLKAADDTISHQNNVTQTIHSNWLLRFRSCENFQQSSDILKCLQDFQATRLERCTCIMATYKVIGISVGCIQSNNCRPSVQNKKQPSGKKCFLVETGYAIKRKHLNIFCWCYESSQDLCCHVCTHNKHNTHLGHILLNSNMRLRNNK